MLSQRRLALKYDPERHRRRSIRLRDYDYRQVGAYFVTLVAHGRQCLFGEVVDGEMRRNEWGDIAHAEWFQTVAVRPYVRLRKDELVVMPNHVHGIIWIVDWHTGNPSGTGDPPGRYGDRPCGPASRSIGAIVAQYKSVVTRRINALRGVCSASIWQRNYYEHIIRDDRDLERIRQYIQDNPVRWLEDRENPNAVAIIPHP